MKEKKYNKVKLLVCVLALSKASLVHAAKVSRGLLLLVLSPLANIQQASLGPSSRSALIVIMARHAGRRISPLVVLVVLVVGGAAPGPNASACAIILAV